MRVHLFSVCKMHTVNCDADLNVVSLLDESWPQNTPVNMTTTEHASQYDHLNIAANTNIMATLLLPLPRMLCFTQCLSVSLLATLLNATDLHENVTRYVTSLDLITSVRLRPSEVCLLLRSRNSSTPSTLLPAMVMSEDCGPYLQLCLGPGGYVMPGVC